MKKVPCREKRPTLQFCPLETEFKLRNRQKFCNVWWIILLGIWSCDGETASCAFWVSQLRTGPERVVLAVPRRGTGDFPGECCDGETASCAFWVSQLRAGPERVASEVPRRGTGDFPGECCDGETASCAFWVSQLIKSSFTIWRAFLEDNLRFRNSPFFATLRLLYAYWRKEHYLVLIFGKSPDDVFIFWISENMLESGMWT